MMRASQSVLLASAQRAATQTSGTIRNAGYRGVRVYLRISAASGTGGLKVILKGVDPVSGQTVDLNTGGTAKTATGTFAYEVYPNAAAAAGNVADAVSRQLPAEFKIEVNHGDASNYTYSASMELLP